MSDLIDQAAEFAAARYPHALAAFLGGSIAGGRATASSDFDITVLAPSGYSVLRDTTRQDGRLVEWFVHTPETVGRFLSEPDRRAVMAHVYGEGVILFDRTGAGAELAAQAREIIAAGPQSRDEAEREAMRYQLTDALDNLTDAVDPFEQLADAAVLFDAASELLCELRGGWVGRGKWQPRRLLAADPVLGRRLLDAHLSLARTGDATELCDAAAAVLAEAGGQIREGFRREWRPDPAAAV
jgi:hypothetical protein